MENAGIPPTDLALPLDVPAIRVGSEPVQSLQTIAAALHARAPEVVRAVHSQATADLASVMIGEIKNFEDRVDQSELGRHLWSLNRLKTFFQTIKNNITQHCKGDRAMLQRAIDEWVAETTRKAEAARAEQANKLKNEAEALRIKEAAKLEKQGKPPEVVNRVLSRPLNYTPPPVVAPKVKDQIVRKFYTVEVYDKRAFLKAITDGAPDQLVNEDYVIIDEGKLARLATQRDGKLAHNGLAVYEGTKGQQVRRSA